MNVVIELIAVIDWIETIERVEIPEIPEIPEIEKIAIGIFEIIFGMFRASNDKKKTYKEYSVKKKQKKNRNFLIKIKCNLYLMYAT